MTFTWSDLYAHFEDLPIVDRNANVVKPILPIQRFA